MIILNIKSKIVASLTSAALVLGISATSAYADTTISVTDNGRGSVNTVTVDNSCYNKIKQKSNTYATNVVNVYQNTGGNEVKDNSGTGDVTITTGDATSSANITVSGGSNTATPPDCCACEEGGTTDITVSDNLRRSINTVGVDNSKTTKVKQKANTYATNSVGVTQKTGRNKVKDNTGDGNKLVETGDTTSTVNITVTGGTNTL